MPKLCLYLQLHQPYRLGDFDVFDLGSNQSYFDTKVVHRQNKAIFKKVAQKSYLPMLQLLLESFKRHPQFTFALSCSGVFLEQAGEFSPQVITLLQQLAATGRVSFLAETYYHSLASLYSRQEFKLQVALHTSKIEELFGITPRVFRNTELVYSNDIAQQVAELGFSGMLTEAVDRYLHGRPKTQLYASIGDQPLPLLLKHAALSDDIAFRFSDKNWEFHPLDSKKYLEWLHAYGDDEYINLFMDFETFGEHQWEDTGIFPFFEKVIGQLAAHAEHAGEVFVTPDQVFETLSAAEIKALPRYDVSQPISWADIDRDLTAWIENAYQQDTLKKLYDLEKTMLATGDSTKIDTWRKLQTSDHFYYMCTKWAADGDVHAYFSPYDSPHEAYRKFAVVLADVAGR